MEITLTSLATAFAAGLLSFASPCVLPLVPAYLAFMAGLAVTGPGGDAERRQVVASAILFVGGFSLVFIALGASASVLGAFLADHREVAATVAGVVLVIFGVMMLGVVRLPWLYGEARFDMGRVRSLGRGAALVMGAAFAFGWTPCVGPVLGAILTMAGATGSVAQGSALLLVYSAGLGVPFLVSAWFFTSSRRALGALARYAVPVQRMGGFAMIVVGIVIASGQMSAVVGLLSRALS